LREALAAAQKREGLLLAMVDAGKKLREACNYAHTTPEETHLLADAEMGFDAALAALEAPTQRMAVEKLLQAGEALHKAVQAERDLQLQGEDDFDAGVTVERRLAQYAIAKENLEAIRGSIGG